MGEREREEEVYVGKREEEVYVGEGGKRRCMWEREGRGGDVGEGGKRR